MLGMIMVRLTMQKVRVRVRNLLRFKARGVLREGGKEVEGKQTFP